MRDRLVVWSGLLGVFFFVGETAIGGWLQPGYSHLRQFISETYASGTPWSDVLRFGGVLPAGVLFTLFGSALAGAWGLSPAGRIGCAAFAIFYGLGTVAAAFFPCDLGCDPSPTDPSRSHVLHFAAGTLTYLFTPPALLMIGVSCWARPHLKALSRTAFIAGGVMLVGVALLFFAPVPELKGLIQRIVEGAAIIFILHSVVLLLREGHPERMVR